MTGHGYVDDSELALMVPICVGFVFFWGFVYWLAYKVLFRFGINTKKKWNKEMLADDLNRNKVTFEDVERYVKEHKQ